MLSQTSTATEEKVNTYPNLLSPVSTQTHNKWLQTAQIVSHHNTDALAIKLTTLKEKSERLSISIQ